MAWFRRILFHSIRLLGGFALAQRLTRHQLRILCYHGFSVADEHELAPYVFMRPETFERRMSILHRRGIPVIALDTAVKMLEGKSVSNCETVLTFDDGWASNLTILPVLEKYNYPGTIYITTEHLTAGPEAFNVALAQMFRRSPRDFAVLHGIHPRLDGTFALRPDPTASIETLLAAAEEIPLAQRQRCLHSIAAALGLDYDDFMRGNRFRFLTAPEIAAIAKRGIDVQLHTHTHSLPADTFESTAREIELNRSAIANLTGENANHFCYPSGRHSTQHPSWLASLGILSATTCDPGLNDEQDSPLLLKRYLDSDATSDIEFEAEVSGAREILRRLRRSLKLSAKA